MLSPESQTDDWQTSVAAEAVHAPFRVGLVCGASVGMLVPLVSLTLQAWLVSLHHWPPVQSLSTLQPPGGWHNEFELHEPERQTVPALAAVHGP